MLFRTWTLALAVIALLLLVDAQAETPAAGDWPQWRGPNRDGISLDTGLLREWPENGPPVVWAVNSVGVGYSSIAVKDGQIYTQGDLDGVEHIICVKVSDGSRVWAVQPEPVAKALATKIADEFKRLDKDGNGTIDEGETLAGFGPDFNNFDRADESADVKVLAATRVAKLFELIDADKDGKLTFAEAGSRFRSSFAKMDLTESGADTSALAKSRTEAIFAIADKDRDGKLTKQEANGTPLQEPFGRADQKDRQTNKGDDLLTVEEVESYFNKQEAGRDGVLSRDEVTAYYEKNYAGKDGQLAKEELSSFLGGYRNSYGDGPRGTPTIDGPLVYTEGGNGDITCLELATGKTIWHKNLTTDFGGGRPGWGYCESPLVYGDLLIVTPGGNKGTLAALDKKTGETVWRTPEVTEGAHYASAQIVELAGVPQLLQFASKDCFAVSTDGQKLLWTYSNANNGTANIATPIAYRDHVYATSAYGTGGGLVKITRDGDKLKAEEVYFDKKLANHHGGVVLVDEHLYGFGSGLICQNFFKGDLAWQARSLTKGSLTYADGLLFLLGENHEVGLAEASPGEYRELGRFKIDNFGRPAWAHPVVAGGKLFIRNMHRLTAYSVGGSK